MIKILSERGALERLNRIISNFRSEISNYESRAKSCLTCDVNGSCCLDTHFVNVHISRLEAAAIRNALEKMPVARREAVKSRIDNAIEIYGLSEDGDTFSQTFACPLFEKGVGCLVHNEAKPSPCIAHGCYENKADLPPDRLLAKQEARIERLNRQTYGQAARLLPLPVAIKRAAMSTPLFDIELKGQHQHRLAAAHSIEEGGEAE